MVAAARKVETTSNLTPPPVAEPAAKDKNEMRVELIAIPIIAVVAAFMLLSLKTAIIMTAIVTVGAIGCLYGPKPAVPAQPPASTATLSATPPPNAAPPAVDQGKTTHARTYAPKADGEFANVIFNSVEDARHFQAACQNERFSAYLECCDTGLDELNKVLYFKSDADAKTKGQIVEAIQTLIR